MQLRDYISLFVNSKQGQVSSATLRSYKNALQNLEQYFQRDAKVSHITAQQIEEWYKWVGSRENERTGKPLSSHTVKRITSTANIFFNWLESKDYIHAAPNRKVALPSTADHRPKAVSKKTYKKLIKQARKLNTSRPRLRKMARRRAVAILHFLASTGCRAGGLCNAKIEGIERTKKGRARVLVREKGGNGGKERYVYLSKKAHKAVKRWLRVRPRTAAETIFVNIDGDTAGQPMTPAGLRQLVSRIAKQAEVKKRHNPHSFRHACAREWLENGADLATVSDLMGHSDIRITAKHYAIFDTKEKDRKHEQFGWD